MRGSHRSPTGCVLRGGVEGGGEEDEGADDGQNEAGSRTDDMSIQAWSNLKSRIDWR
jgi:hypothetical protein